jgi:hypothetical protein
MDEGERLRVASLPDSEELMETRSSITLVELEHLTHAPNPILYASGSLITSTGVYSLNKSLYTSCEQLSLI